MASILLKTLSFKHSIEIVIGKVQSLLCQETTQPDLMYWIAAKSSNSTAKINFLLLS